MKQEKFFLSILLLIIILLSSCTFVTEPDRIYNDKAYPPNYYSFNFNDLKSGQHVDGTIELFFNPSGINYEVTKIIIAIDDTPYVSAYTLPCTLILDTRRYSEGIHKISFWLYQNKKPNGLLNILNTPSDVFETQLYFDRTPPDSVTLSVSSNDGKEINLNWSESNCQTFYSYLIYKSVDDGPFIRIDSIRKKDETIFTDTSGVNLIGVEFKYKVAVTTDYKYTFQSYSNSDSCVLGNAYKYEYAYRDAGPFLNESLSRIYFMADNKLVSFSTNDNSLIKETDLSEFMTYNESFSFAFNQDKSEMYFYMMHGNKLLILNSVDQTVIKYLSLPCGGYLFFVLDDSRILFNTNSSFKIVNTDYNQIENSVDFTDGYTTSCGILNSDNSRLILNRCWRSWPWYLDIIDVTNNNFSILDSIKTYDPQFTSMQRDENKLICNGIYVYDINTFNSLGTLNVDGYIYSFSVANNKISILQRAEYNIPNLYDISCRNISIYDLQSQKIKEWYLKCGSTMAMNDKKVFVNIPFSQEPVKHILGYSLKYE